MRYAVVVEKALGRGSARGPDLPAAPAGQRRWRTRIANAFHALFRMVAILGLFVICLLPLHKGYMDFTALAQKYSGDELWLAFGRYLFRNMAGGG